LANTSQARKRARQQEHQRLHNRQLRSRVRSAVKSFLKAAGGSDRDAAASAFRNASSEVDRAAGKNLTHRNRAARLKSRMNQRLRAMA